MDYHHHGVNVFMFNVTKAADFCSTIRAGGYILFTMYETDILFLIE